MARLNHKSAGRSAITRPVLTGEDRSDLALWQLSSILAEIAEHSIRSETEVDVATKCQIDEEISAEQATNGVEDENDA